MLRLKCSYVCWCVIIAIWTIIQTAAHCYGIIYVMWWRDCKVDPDDKDHNLLYLTYFFTRKCENETRTVLATNRNIILTILDNTVNSTLDHVAMNCKLDTLITIYLILDALWIVASVALLTGACLKIRERWALPFYVPWIVMDAIILLFDGFCSIFFGLNIPNDGTIFDWLHFIGVNIRFNEIKKLEGDMPALVAGAASVIMMFISARGGIVWILNLVFMVVVIKATRRAVRKPPPSTSRRRNRSFMTSERIRKWNQFYGSVECERNKIDGKNVFVGRLEDGTGLEELQRNSGDVEEEVSGSTDSNSGEVPDKLVDGVVKMGVERVPMKELRGQVPWSYVDAHVEAIRPDIVPDKLFLAKDEGVSKF